jgi:hypothetical protein
MAWNMTSFYPALLVALAWAAGGAGAATGELDESFAAHGRVQGFHCCTSSLREAADRTLLLARWEPIPRFQEPVLTVVRIAPDGGVSFWAPPFLTPFDAFDAVPQPDGGALVFGSLYLPEQRSTAYVIKLNAQGQLDPAFGDGVSN